MSVSIPRPEHPNPQFQRESWQNLNGEWQFEIDHGRSGCERDLQNADSLSGKIIVPFCPESALSGVQYTDFMDAVWYRRTIEISKEQLENRVMLHFGAVDYEAFVYVNGVEVGTHRGGFVGFSFDITERLFEGENVITVYAEDCLRDPSVPHGKQSERFASHGCDYTRTTGIWQTVWLEFVPQSYLKSVKLFPSLKNGSLTLQAQVVGVGTLKADIYYGGRLVGFLERNAQDELVSGDLRLSEIHPWEPGKGRLYDIRFSFGEDVVSSYFGLRDLRLEQRRFCINDKSVFQRLVLDQGFYPDGIFTAPDDADLVKDIEISLAAGFNGARLHQKVFEPRFLYHCDRLGYIVWGEYPCWGADYSSPESLFSILPEWCEAVARDFNHPSIVGWCPFNETWDYAGRRQRDDLLRIIYRTTKQLDPTRPCIDTSGNYHVETDIFDLHDYEQNPAIFRKQYESFAQGGNLKVHHGDRQRYEGQPMFVSEYGGIKWALTTDEDAWGYGDAPKTLEEFIARYRALTDILLDNPNMFGFCYTQLYDIEQEQNGLYTYAREPKFSIAVFHEINSRIAAIEQ